jgi:hypothetical protein
MIKVIVKRERGFLYVVKGTERPNNYYAGGVGEQEYFP